MPRLVITRNNQIWSVHTHSKFSYDDALPEVQQIVDEAQRLGHKGLALTDHGNMAGSVQLYQACMKAGIKPFPGSELYFVPDRSVKKAKRHHVGVLAYTTEGYRNLVHLSTLTHSNFYNKPLIDYGDMATLHEEGRTKGLALTTGCYFGIVIQTLIKEGIEAARQIVATFAQWFDVYVEIQNHNIDHGEGILSEAEIAAALMEIAADLELPVVISQDSHYVKKEDKPDHDSLKRLIAYGPEADDAVFPGDGFHMVDDRWMQAHHSPEVFQSGAYGLDRLLSKWDMAIPEMDEYNYRIPDVGDLGGLKRRVVRRATELGLAEKNAYFNQIMLEFEIIDHARMWGYLGLVAQVCDHMREVNMFYQVRGSAAGSLICFLLQISEHDPIKWKLRMDRFLSKDRTKPPDIDIDVESGRRMELINWINSQFAAQQIGTWRKYTIDGSEDGKGSIRIRYMARRRAMGETPTWSKIPAEDRDEMNRISDREPYSGVGTHAAGLLVTSHRQELEELVPLMWLPKTKSFVTQYDGKDVEAIGAVKLDVLGVKNLDILRLTLESLGRDPQEGLGWIPLNDRKTFAQIAKGVVDGVFQLEGPTSARCVKQLRPTKIGDVIASMALFRPGVMNSGAMEVYFRRKRKDEEVPNRHPLITEATKETFGILLYQDSVIQILRELGMDVDSLNAMLKAIKASNKNVAAAKVVMEHHKPGVRGLCEAVGIKEKDFEWLWTSIENFGEYGFNRAHATVYGITAYRCAYLSTHHELDFHAAMLAVAAGEKKERQYIRAAMSKEIRLLRPDVRYSKRTYSVDPKRRGIRRGLTAIKGIGNSVGAEIEKHQPYEDIADFVSKVTPRIVSGVNDYNNTGSFEIGKLGVLHQSGALNSLLKTPVY